MRKMGVNYSCKYNNVVLPYTYAVTSFQIFQPPINDGMVDLLDGGATWHAGDSYHFSSDDYNLVTKAVGCPAPILLWLSIYMMSRQ